MCCLKYEQDAYEDALKRMPKNDSFVQTPDGLGNVCEVNVLRETMKVRLDEKPDSPGAITTARCASCATAKEAVTASRCPRSGPSGMWRSGPRRRSPCRWSSRTLTPTPPAREERPPRRRNDRRRKGGSRPQQAGEKAPEEAEKPRQTEKKASGGHQD